ncbi:MAG: hypothetical protein NXI14_11955 [bacterium]|nr:hypothetical protein [bacterium]
MASEAKTVRIKPAPAGWNLAALLVALVICAVLGIAAYSKIVDPSKAKFITIGGSELRYERFIGIFEVLVILALLAGHRLRLAWLGVVAMFALFSGYAGYYFATGNSCGCFGNALDGTALEWMTIKGVSVAFDVVFVVAALALLGWRGFGAKMIQGLVGLALILSAAGAGLGWLEYTNSPGGGAKPPPPPPNGNQVQSLPPGLQVNHQAAALLRQGAYASLIASSAANPDKMWYVFVYDPDCSECMEMKPVVDMLKEQYEAEDNPYMEVLSVTKQDAQDAFGIDFWAWESGATIIIVQGGDILRVNDERLTPGNKPTPDMVMEDFFNAGAIESNWPPASGE